jgi:hypothetical protein
MIQDNELVRTFSQEREAIETRFVNRFDTTQTPVQYGNVNVLKQGMQSIPTPYRGRAFVRLNIVGGDREQPEVTRSITRINGTLNIGVFTQQDLGSQLARSLVDEIFPIFNAVVFNGITTGPATVRELPPNNGWYVMNVSIPYVWYRCIPT